MQHSDLVTVSGLQGRFWSKVRKSAQADGCWLWMGSRGGSSGNSYGVFWGGYELGTLYAHRVAYELQNGPIPAGLAVCHRCDNRLCMRGDHLFLGTLADNFADMRAKGRQARGESHHGAKLTEISAREIRARYAAGGVSQAALAREYGVNFRTIHLLVKGEIWRHLT